MKFHFNKQSKYIFIELALCGAAAAFATSAAVNHIQADLEKSYSDFAQLAVKSIASEAAASGVLNMNNAKPGKIYALLSEKFENIIKSGSDIVFIEYKDKDGNVLYSSKEAHFDAGNKIFLSVNSPVVENGIVKGSITAGMTGKNISSVSKTAKNSIFIVFLLMWFLFASILILNIFLISKELKKIYRGVKQAASGRFGYNVKSENMKELADAFNDMSNMLFKYDEENIKRLALERNKFEAVLMSIINGVIMCDIYDTVVLANSAALKMLDIEQKNFINTKIQNYIDSHGAKCFLEKIEEFKDTPLNIKEHKPLEFNIEAGRRTIKAVISPMFLKQRDYAGYIIVLIDITREEEVNKLKNTFISNVSHELRTPVTVLRTYTDTLCSNAGDFDEKTKKEFLDIIDKEAKRLHSMVNEILDFSRIESQTVKLRKEYADLTELLKQNIASIKILAEEKNIKIHFIEKCIMPKVPINIESMDRAVRNLLSNAVKYSPAGKDIEVTAGLSENKKSAVFSVKDNGIGIAKEHQDKIFDRFYRVENAAHTIKGTGLGLHLVKITIENHHHGKITVKSAENKGAEFTVYLPLTVPEDELL